MNKTAVIIGASGLVGGYLLDYLLAEPSYQSIVSLVRKPTGKVHSKLQEKIINFDSENAFDGITAHDSFCCLGTTIKVAGSKEAFYKVDCSYPFSFAKAMKGQGANRFFIVTAMGSNINSTIFYNQVKGEVEQKIQSLHFETCAIFRPSLLLGNRPESRIGERIGKTFATFLDPVMQLGLLKKYRAIPAQQVAQYMINTSNSNKCNFLIIESDKMWEGVF